MSHPLTTVTTDAGTFTLGSFASTFRLEPLSGQVTSIWQTGLGTTIEINGRRSAPADCFNLDAGPDPVAHALLNQHRQGVAAGAFEVRLPAEDDRIFFCSSAEEVIALLARTIGLNDQDRELAYLNQAVALGPLKELRWRGAFGTVGQLAYVSTAQDRPAPQFAIGAQVTSLDMDGTHAVEGIKLLYNHRTTGSQGHWYYLLKNGTICAWEARLRAVAAQPVG